MSRKDFLNSLSCTPLPHLMPAHRTCQWIDGHGKHKVFSCKQETIPGSSYCADHHAVVFEKYVPDLEKMRRVG
jgi:hypothetical protein